MDSSELAVHHNEAHNRYEVQLGSQRAVLEYQHRGNHIIYIHTGVPKEFEGQGIAAKLAKAALDDARAQGLSIVAQCSYIAAYIRRHREYQDLLASH